MSKHAKTQHGVSRGQVPLQQFFHRNASASQPDPLAQQSTPTNAEGLGPSISLESLSRETDNEHQAQQSSEVRALRCRSFSTSC